MKLSFSTKGWHGKTFEEFCAVAQEIGFSGIELHNLREESDLSHGGAFHPAKAADTVRDLYRRRLSIVCIDVIADAAKDKEDFLSEIRICFTVAKNLHVPYLRVHAKHVSDSDKEAARERVIAALSEIQQEAAKFGVCVLLETVGLFADTAFLRETLEYFACDEFGALWNITTAYLGGREKADTVIRNLGAYVKHVHINDAKIKENGAELCLIGEGEMPVEDAIRALRSVNYDGFFSLVWDPAWCPELDDMETVFSQFVNYIGQFEDVRRSRTVLYHNKAGTGKYVWKKEMLIDETFPQVLDRMVKEFPDQYAFRYTTLNYTRTYSEFRDDVDEFARALISLGVRPGSHVAVWATNVPEWYISFWAATKIGAVLVTVNTAYKIAEVEYLLKQSDTHTLIMVEKNLDSDYGKIMAQLCPELKDVKPGEGLHCKRLPFLRNIITIGYKQEGCLSFKEALEYAERTPLEEVYRYAEKVDKNDVCNMQYTSGTTGFPKGVMLTHYNVVNNGKCIGDRMDLSTADRMMIQVPMFHCFGMVLAMTATMTHGGTCLPLPYFSTKASLACINSEHVTAFHGVPTMFIAMLEHPDFEKTDFSYMRTGIMAGSPCPISTMRDVVEKMHMKEITIVYGQTEASPGCTMSSTDDPIEIRVGTVGRPLPEIECKIVDPETGLECPDEVPGEFLARGYNVMKGYYKMPEATAAAIDAEGWLHTGDLACRTKEGNFRITGRLKDMIIRGGENIYPKEIEEFIYTNPKVRDVQVIGVPDEQYGEEILACVILKEGESMTEEELKDYVKANMARHKVPKYVEFTDAFPMNAAGKILKYKMREEAIEKLGLQKASKVVTA